MFAWVKSLFGSMDRTTAASERTAKAAEDIADMMEQVRDQFRGRLGIEAPATVVEVKPLPAQRRAELLAKDEPEPEPAKGRKSKG
jgi:hypothetical protein